MATYTKLALGVDGIIALLKARGLVIKNEDEAKKQLGQVRIHSKELRGALFNGVEQEVFHCARHVHVAVLCMQSRIGGICRKSRGI